MTKADKALARQAWTENDWDGHVDIPKLIQLVRADEREAILPMLKGIDQTECEDPDGWWETSTGAAFGAGILAAIRARGNT